MRVLFGGSSGSGKSTLATSIFCYLRSIKKSVALYELDTFSDTHQCLLGRKPWSKRKKRESGLKDPLLLETKSMFLQDNHNLVIGDLMGKIDNITEYLTKKADCAILIARSKEEIEYWKDFMSFIKVPILMVLSRFESDKYFYIPQLYRKVTLSSEIACVANKLLMG